MRESLWSEVPLIYKALSQGKTVSSWWKTKPPEKGPRSRELRCGKPDQHLALQSILTFPRFLWQVDQPIKVKQQNTVRDTSLIKTSGSDSQSLKRRNSLFLYAFSTTEALYTASEDYRRLAQINLCQPAQLRDFQKDRTLGKSSIWDCQKPALTSARCTLTKTRFFCLEALVTLQSKKCGHTRMKVQMRKVSLIKLQICKKKTFLCKMEFI